MVVFLGVIDGLVEDFRFQIYFNVFTNSHTICSCGTSGRTVGRGCSGWENCCILGELM
jgi:hypothetical protein